MLGLFWRLSWWRIQRVYLQCRRAGEESRESTCSAGGLVENPENPPAVHEAQVRPLGRKDPLEKGMETHSSVLAKEARGPTSQRLQPMQLQ